MKGILVLVLLFPVGLYAQDFHISLRAGAANYAGDLQSAAISTRQVRWMGSLGLRYDVSDHLQARTYFTYGKLQADDKYGNAGMRARNLNFKTEILEWEGSMQYDFFSLNDRWWTPYVYAGIGFFHFNPYTNNRSGMKTYLPPLSTEGEGFAPGVSAYKLTQFMIPFGLGAEYALNEDMRLGLEFGYRKLFTDYLDDVSGRYVDRAALLAARGQTAVDLAYRGDEVGAGPYPPAGDLRGSNRNKDAYYYFALTFTVRSFLSSYRKISGLPAYKRSKKVGCPANRF